jgi:hypothetical protein
MLWFFERPGESLRCEIRRAETGAEFELVWAASDGHVHVERSDDLSALVHRRNVLEWWLRLDGWIKLGQNTPPRAGTCTQRIIVRRGDLATFALLERTFTDHPGVAVTWDRRLGDRRLAARPNTGTEPRQNPPVQWQQLNYLIVPDPERRTRPSSSRTS